MEVIKPEKIISQAQYDAARITYAPATRRFELKIPTNASDQDKEAYTKLLDKVMETDMKGIDKTIRGSIKFYNEKYSIRLKSNNKDQQRVVTL
jgi:hypothetical protein